MPRTLEWERAVCFYSRAQLTFANDKFVVLSGVARGYQNASQDQYIAGLWRSSFAEQLCWTVLHSGQRKSPTVDPIPYRAPTWSWASTDEPVTWVSIADPTYEPLFGNPNLIDIIELVLDGSDTFGRLQDGMVEIKCGPILTETLDVALRDHKRVINRVYFDDSTTKIPERNDDGQNSTTGIYFLPVHRGKRIRLHGLILRSSERGKGYFSRIGNWEAIFGSHTYEYVVKNLLLGSKFLMDEALYEEVLESENEVPQYSITLV